MDGLDLLFETKPPQEEPAEPEQEDTAEVEPLLESVLKMVELHISKVHLRIQHDDGGSQLAVGIVVDEHDGITVKDLAVEGEKPIAAHHDLGLHKRVVLSIPAVYADAQPVMIGKGILDQPSGGSSSSMLNPLSFLERKQNAKKQNDAAKLTELMHEAAQKKHTPEVTYNEARRGTKRTVRVGGQWSIGRVLMEPLFYNPHLAGWWGAAAIDEPGWERQDRERRAKPKLCRWSNEREGDAREVYDRSKRFARRQETTKACVCGHKGK